MRTGLFAVLSAAAGVAILVALAFSLKLMLPLGRQFLPSAPPSSQPADAEETLWVYVDDAQDQDLVHSTTTILQRQPWSDGEIILFTYEDTLPESSAGGRHRVLGWVLVEPDREDAGWTVVAAGNRKRVHWPVDRTIPAPEDIPVHTFWLSERRDGEGQPLSVIYGLWDARLGDTPEAMTLTLGDRSTEIPLRNDTFLYVTEGSLTERQPQISWDCDPPGGGRCIVALHTDEHTVRPRLPVFAGEIQSQNRSVDLLTGRLVPYTLGQPDPADRFAPGRLFTPAEVHFSLHWEVVSPPSADWRVFVHLVREGTGELAAQSDVRVDWPTQPCTEGDYGGAERTVSSKHHWTFPANFPPGLYFVEVGLYDPETGERAPVTSPGGGAGKTTVWLGQVKIAPEDQAEQEQGQEEKLANLFVNDPTAECGWEVLGEADRETYLWAICQSPSGTAVSAPAVVYWTKSEAGIRRIRDVQMPRDGSFYGQDVRRLFPAKMEERILDHDVDMDAIWEQIEHDLTTITGTVVDNAVSARVVTLEDEDGKQWHVPWGASAGVRWSDGSRAQFRDLGRGMMVEVVGFPRTEAATPNALTAIRVTILDEDQTN